MGKNKARRVIGHPRSGIAFVAAGALIALAACSSGTTSTPAAPAESSAAPAASSSAAPAASTAPAEAGSSFEQISQFLLSETGSYSSPPTTAPAPQAGKNLWLISCGQAYTSCSIPIGAAEEAAQSIGWATKIFDDQGDPTTVTTGIRQAIADKADAIFMYYIDCVYAAEALSEAREAGIKVAAAESADCSDLDPAAESLFDYSVTYSGGLDGPVSGGQSPYAEQIGLWGQAQGNLGVVKAGGKVNALVFTDNYGFGGKRAAEGMNEVLGSCDGCTSQVIEFPYEDLANGNLATTVSQALLKNPEANVVAAAYDAIVVYGLAQAAAEVGRELIVIGGEGSAEGMDLVRAGQITLGAGLPLGWEGYAAVDALNRILQGEEPAPTGMGLQLFDAESNVPASGGYVPPFDYKAIYQQAWGV
jgi:ribose transport system substrate-binding protein